MLNIDTNALAQEFLEAYRLGAVIPSPPSARYDDFDMTAAYAVEAAFMRGRVAGGHQSTGLKVGYANKAVWRALKLETLVWGHMYDDTVHLAAGDTAELVLPYYRSPKIEPEIVFKLRQPLSAELDAAGVLEAVEWLALGFEIIDGPFPDWTFKPTDFVAAFGLHLALVVGRPLKVESSQIPALAEQLAAFKVKLSRGDQQIEEGSGKNSLRSPALCLAELAGALSRQSGAEPLSVGDLISSGTLTTSQPCGKGEVWSAAVDGLPLSGLTVRLA